jgi:hypothetical protein
MSKNVKEELGTFKQKKTREMTEALQGMVNANIEQEQKVRREGKEGKGGEGWEGRGRGEGGKKEEGERRREEGKGGGKQRGSVEEGGSLFSERCPLEGIIE